MRKIGRFWFLAVVLGLMIQGCAWSAVSIWWVDAGGTHTVNLQYITNPEWNTDPLNVEPQFVWDGVLNITMNSFSPITFTGSGNFIGDLGLAWPTVRLQQNVLNNTDKPWTDFHLGLGPTGNRFYKVWQVAQGWSATKMNYTVDFLYTYTCGSRTLPGQTFVDGIYLKAKTDAGGNGTFTLTKYPTYVPEAGTVAVLFSGALGLLSHRIRRRKS